MVNEHVLFDIVFNTVIRNIQSSLVVIDGILGESCKNMGTHLSCDSPNGGGNCGESDSAHWSARGLVEHKVAEYKRIHQSDS